MARNRQLGADDARAFVQPGQPETVSAERSVGGEATAVVLYVQPQFFINLRGSVTAADGSRLIFNNG